MKRRPPFFSIILLSAGALAYEILLMRLFSIIQWHHFAYMIISLALLGYGMSGTIISIAQKSLIKNYTVTFVTLIVFFGLSSLAAFLSAQAIPFNAEEILWDTKQLWYLLGVFLVLTVPFFFAACAICLTFRCYKEHVARIYSCDLLGAGCGSIYAITLLYSVMPQTALLFTCVSMLLAAVAATWELHLKHRRSVTMWIVLSAISIVIAIPHVDLKISPYKGLQQTMRIKGTSVIEESSSPLGVLTVLESTKIPLRFVPGLSLNNYQEPLAQLGIFTDGDNMTVITKKAEHHEQLAYLDQVSSAIGYHLNKPDRVLILGAGGGTDVLQAKYHGVSYIDAVELNPQISHLVRNRYIDYAGMLYDDTTTKLYISEIRGFVNKTEQQYNLIQLALTDGFNGSAAGVYALNENYLYTVEALQDYIVHLVPGGYLAITRWIKMPPRDTLKLFATAVDSLKGMGVNKPEDRLVLIRSWQTSTLLIKKGEFTEAEIEDVQNFCDERSFDIAYTPTMTKTRANRYNTLQQPYFYLAAKSLIGDQAEEFIGNYKFNIKPATDDRPYFNHFFKWSSLAEILRLRHQGSAPLLESGYLVLVATLVLSLIISATLILLPLWTLQKESLMQPHLVSQLSIVIFFLLIGLAFLFVEIAFLQKLIQFLHHPIYAVSSGLASFLIFAGLGSHFSQILMKKFSITLTMKMAVTGLAVMCCLYISSLDSIFVIFGDRALALRLFVSVVLIAPLAILMGMPFPLAMKDLADRAEQRMPWAWGINGCASVISATLATILAIHFGFSFLVGLAVIFYVGAYTVFKNLSF